MRLVAAALWIGTLPFERSSQGPRGTRHRGAAEPEGSPHRGWEWQHNSSRLGRSAGGIDFELSPQDLDPRTLQLTPDGWIHMVSLPGTSPHTLSAGECPRQSESSVILFRSSKA